MKKKLAQIGFALVPALVTGAVILGCSSAPVLQKIPALLELSPVESQTAEPSPSPEASPSPSRVQIEAEEEDTAEAIELVVQGVGDYTDGVYTGTGTGYGGDITVQVTMENGQITAIEILSASGETDSFLSRAKGVIDSILTAQTWEVDAISGATYSSNGIKAAVQNALTGEVVETETATTVSGNSSALVTVSYTTPEGGYADGTYTGSAQGFGGTITVQVTISDGTITAITVVSAPGETSSYLSRAKAVISSVIAAQSPNVDTVSGATYSSNGILNAIKNALSKAAGTVETSASPSPSPSQAAEDVPNYGYVDGTYQGTGTGFGGDITVSLTVEGGQITAIEILSAEDETPAFLEQAKSILDSILSVQTAQVDAVSGATYSSNGILEAVAQALAQATVSASPSPEPSAEASEEPSPSPSAETPNYGYTDGVYQGTGEGFDGDITVSVTVTDGQITAIEIVSAEGETPAYLSRATALLDLVLVTQTCQVDAVSGATYSSQGILDAIKQALEQAGTSTESASASPSPSPSEEASESPSPSVSPSASPESSPSPSTSEEPSVTVTTVQETYTSSATVNPDEDEGFTAYTMTLTVTVEVTTTTTVTEDVTTVVTQRVVTDCEASADTSKTNLRYLSKALSGMKDGLLASGSADAVSGATCSSTAIRSAWSSALAGVTLGTTTEQYATAGEE